MSMEGTDTTMTTTDSTTITATASSTVVHVVPSPVVGRHNKEYFDTLLVEIRGELLPQLPSCGDIENHNSFAYHVLRKALASVVDARTTYDALIRVQKSSSSSDEDKQRTAGAVEDAERALTTAIDVATYASKPIVDYTLQYLYGHCQTLDTLLTKCSILTNAIPQLVEFCTMDDRNDEGHNTKLVDDLLSNVDVMRDMLYNGGPKNGNYGQAIQIYTNIMKETTTTTTKKSGTTTKTTTTQPPQKQQEQRGLLSEQRQRLAMAVSLELAAPLYEFDTKIPVDPIARFLHYQNAYVHNELDSTFGQQSTWLYRWVVNSDAPNEQLSWGRHMVQTYRPDIWYWEDYKWRYAYIVRTDVTYKDPDWDPSEPHRSYPQIISGGGKCGPRAWFGRFVLKAAGIPTWGVRQPGHAALGHWMPPTDDNKSDDGGGWVICLGAAWKYSWWEGRDGSDFVLEARARQQAIEDYMGVCRLEWIADAWGETPIHGKLDPNSLWQSLALLHKRHLANRSTTAAAAATAAAEAATTRGETETNGDPNCSNNNNTLDKNDDATKATNPMSNKDDCIMIESNDYHDDHLLQSPTTIIDNKDNIARYNFRIKTLDENNTIRIPAVACSKPTKGTKNAIFMKSYLGDGMQLHIREDQSIEYTVAIPKSKRYYLTIQLVTVHRKTQPLLLTIASSMTSTTVDDNNDDTCCSCDCSNKEHDDDDDSAVVVMVESIVVPYTEGSWAWTERIEIQLERGSNVLTLTRQTPNYGLSLKELVLTPVST